MQKIKQYLWLLALVPGLLFAAKTEFIDVDTIYNKPDQLSEITQYSINLSSSGNKIPRSEIQLSDNYKNELLYLNKVRVNNKIYYRLVLGNFKTQQEASSAMRGLKQVYPSSWINFRTNTEMSELSARLFKRTPAPAAAAIPVIPKPKLPATPAKPAVSPPAKPGNEGLADSLLQDAKQKFIDQNYARVLAITGKVGEIGTLQQKQEALELSGIVRERQEKIPQAIAIYSEFLALYPDSEIAPKVKNRLEGLKTMNFDPRKRLPTKSASKAEEWNLSGSVSQYYRNDILEIDTVDTENVNSALVSDVNLFARKKTETDSLVLRFDGGMISDFLDSTNQGRISRAMVDYTNNEGEYQLIGGRQNRTAKGVLGRFDGFVYRDLSYTDWSYSLYTGFPVDSSYDAVDSNRLFFGGSVSVKYSNSFDMDYYVVQQTNAGLTDRQAIGTEFQYRSDKGFVYGIFDYDIYYNDLNNVTAITNYRHSDKLSFNLTIDYRNSPLLTTENAIQGQGVETLDDLKSKTDLTDAQIYQLAEDRTSKSSNLYAGSTYKIDDDRQIYLSLALSTVDATKASAATATTPAIDAIDAYDSVYISGDYTIRGFFRNQDYTTFGVRLSDTTSTESTSFLARTRFESSIKNLRYDPRLRVDFRQSKTTNDDQYIINPSLKVSYKSSKKLNLEGSVGLEYSNFDLPNRNDQTYYNLFLGYTYQF